MKFPRREPGGAPRGPAPHRAGGLKYVSDGVVCISLGPAPHRAGGLKCEYCPTLNEQEESRPPQGGWIEIGFCQARHLNR